MPACLFNKPNICCPWVLDKQARVLDAISEFMVAWSVYQEYLSPMDISPPPIHQYNSTTNDGRYRFRSIRTPGSVTLATEKVHAWIVRATFWDSSIGSARIPSPLQPKDPNRCLNRHDPRI